MHSGVVTLYFIPDHFYWRFVWFDIIYQKLAILQILPLDVVYLNCCKKYIVQSFIIIILMLLFSKRRGYCKCFLFDRKQLKCKNALCSRKTIREEVLEEDDMNDMENVRNTIFFSVPIVRIETIWTIWTILEIRCSFQCL